MKAVLLRKDGLCQQVLVTTVDGTDGPLRCDYALRLDDGRDGCFLPHAFVSAKHCFPRSRGKADRLVAYQGAEEGRRMSETDLVRLRLPSPLDFCLCYGDLLIVLGRAVPASEEADGRTSSTTTTGWRIRPLSLRRFKDVVREWKGRGDRLSHLDFLREGLRMCSLPTEDPWTCGSDGEAGPGAGGLAGTRVTRRRPDRADDEEKENEEDDDEASVCPSEEIEDDDDEEVADDIANDDEDDDEDDDDAENSEGSDCERGSGVADTDTDRDEDPDFVAGEEEEAESDGDDEEQRSLMDIDDIEPSDCETGYDGVGRRGDEDDGDDDRIVDDGEEDRFVK